MRRHLFALTVVLVLAACQPDATLQATLNASNTQLAATATASAVVPTPTTTPTPRATASPTPCCGNAPVEVTPCGAYICEVPGSTMTDEDIAARLCTVESRGMAEVKDDACKSVISTVLTRIETGEYSDGSWAGTVGWGCTPESAQCQLPAHIVHGCLGILPEACVWSYPVDIAYFTAVAREALNGDWGGASCLGYLHYDSMTINATDCVIRADNGQVIGFNNGE